MTDFFEWAFNKLVCICRRCGEPLGDHHDINLEGM
jgi:hypothetical protein